MIADIKIDRRLAWLAAKEAVDIVFSDDLDIEDTQSYPKPRQHVKRFHSGFDTKAYIIANSSSYKCPFYSDAVISRV